jgi:hypothetical protein
VSVRPGASAEFVLHVRNFKPDAQAHRIRAHAPPGLSVEPPVLEGELPGESAGLAIVKVSAAADAPLGVHIVAFDVTLDGIRYGEWFDMIVNVGEPGKDAGATVRKSEREGY